MQRHCRDAGPPGAAARGDRAGLAFRAADDGLRAAPAARDHSGPGSAVGGILRPRARPPASPTGRPGVRVRTAAANFLSTSNSSG